LEERLFYRRRASPRFYTAKKVAVQKLNNSIIHSLFLFREHRADFVGRLGLTRAKHQAAPFVRASDRAAPETVSSCAEDQIML
jgi:hypothetical protein